MKSIYNTNKLTSVCARTWDGEGSNWKLTSAVPTQASSEKTPSGCVYAAYLWHIALQLSNSETSWNLFWNFLKLSFCRSCRFHCGLGRCSCFEFESSEDGEIKMNFWIDDPLRENQCLPKLGISRSNGANRYFWIYLFARSQEIQKFKFTPPLRRRARRGTSRSSCWFLNTNWTCSSLWLTADWWRSLAVQKFLSSLLFSSRIAR